MRVVQGGFVDGTPAGGTVVRAFFLNSVQGELAALLALFGEQPLPTGDSPSENHQLADLFGQYLCRVAQTYPDAAPDLAVLIDPVALGEGEWPFRIRSQGQWITAPMPDFASETPTLPTPDSPPFTDEVHGSRGGADLHALATEDEAGFLSPAGFQALSGLAATRPRIYQSPWQTVTPGQQLVLTHGLNAIPQLIEVSYKSSQFGPVPVRSFFNAQNQYVGASIWQVTEAAINIAVGDRLWEGYANQGLQSLVTGQFQVMAIAFGQA